MKLKNKLIPFAIATTAITAVTPLSVSCSSKSSMRDISSLEAAKPDFKPYHSVPAWFEVDEDEQEDTAMKAYIDFVKKDPKRFEQDMAWGVYQNWLSFYDNSNLAIYYEGNITHKFESKINKLEVSITNVEFGTTNILMPHRGSKAYKSYNTVSFKMKLHVNADVNTVEPYNNTMAVIKKNIDTTSTVEYNNMLIFAMQTARDNKLNQFINETRSTVDQMAYDTNKAGWLITISDNSDNQSIYNNYFEEHGIKFNTDITIKESDKYGDSDEIVTSSTGHYANTVKNTADFNELVNEKNYAQLNALGMSVLSSPEYIDDDTTIGRWFHQDPAQIVANSVLLDIWSYYFSNTYTSPKFYFGDNDDTNEYVDAGAELVHVNLVDDVLPTYADWYDESKAFDTRIGNMKWADSSFGYSEDCEYGWPDLHGLTLTYDTTGPKTFDKVGSQTSHMTNEGIGMIKKVYPDWVPSEGDAFLPRNITLDLDTYDNEYIMDFGTYDVSESKLSNDDIRAITAFHDLFLPRTNDPRSSYKITLDRPFFDYETRENAKAMIQGYLEDTTMTDPEKIAACVEYLPYLDVVTDYIPFKFPANGKIKTHFIWVEGEHEDDPYQFEMSLPDNLVVRFGYGPRENV